MKSSAAREGQLDKVFRALGDQTRRQILRRLAKGPAKITELAQPFDMSLPAVSKHVRVLERAGLIQRTIDGRVHECAIRAAPLQSAAEWVERYRMFWEGTLDSLAAYVEDE